MSAAEYLTERPIRTNAGPIFCVADISKKRFEMPNRSSTSDRVISRSLLSWLIICLLFAHNNSLEIHVNYCFLCTLKGAPEVKIGRSAH